MMKKIALYLWNALIISTILAGISLLIVSRFIESRIIASIIIIAAIIAGTAIALFLLRKLAKLTAKFLLSIVLGTIAGIAAISLFLLSKYSFYFAEKLPLVLFILYLFTIILFVFFTWRNIIAGIITLLIILIITFIAVHIGNLKHQEFLKSQASLWKKKGWPVNEKEIFPKPATNSMCQPWFDKIDTMLNKNANESFRKNIHEFSGSIVNALANGTELIDIIAKSPLSDNQQWESFIAINPAIIEAMNKCPYIQWFDPEMYKTKPWEIGFPKLLDLFDWIRSVDAYAMIIASKGQTEEAKTLCGHIHTAAIKFYIPGQVLNNTLAGIAIDKIAAHCYAGIQQITKSPYSPEDRELFKTNAMTNPAWITSILDSQRWCAYRFYEHYGSIGNVPPVLALLSKWRALNNALLRHDAEYSLKSITKINEWITTVPDFKNDLFKWHDLPPIETNPLEKRASFAFEWYTTYARLAHRTLVWNLVLAMDDVYLSYQENNTLPNSAEILPIPLPIDAFSDQPLLYRKIDETHFIVYSIGPDEIDNKGETIFVSGPLDIHKSQDIGYMLGVKPRH